jgi:hypothetical protein
MHTTRGLLFVAGIMTALSLSREVLGIFAAKSVQESAVLLNAQEAQNPQIVAEYSKGFHDAVYFGLIGSAWYLIILLLILISVYRMRNSN